ncbi:MAG: DUF1854 domain-containing protein, partial [Gemmatimonadota bacterium]|nr:DUF1854 domain-containing protein [Gemmatimonadota bacterium]
MSSLPNLTGDLSLLSPRDIRLYLDDFDDLTLDLRGEIHERIGVLRAFPLNASTKFIVLRDSDGGEIGIVRDMVDLDPDSRDALEIALEQAYFMPRILKINSIVSN